jgi:hypothetical protein
MKTKFLSRLCGGEHPQHAASALTAIDTIGTLLQGRAVALEPDQLEAVGQLLKEAAMLSLCAFGYAK